MSAMKSIVAVVIWSVVGGAVAAQGDACSTAQAAVVNGATPFSSVGFTVVDQTPSCGGAADPFDFWFSFTAPVTGVAVATLCPSSQFAAGGASTPADSALSAWTGACGALAQIACSTSSPTCGPGPAETAFAVSAGSVYFVRVVAEGGGPVVGTMALAVNTGPCATPINDVPVQGTEVVANLQGPATYDNSCANTDIDPAPYMNPPPKPNRDVWVCFAPLKDQCFRLTNLATFDTEIEIFVESTGSSGITYDRQSGTAGEGASAHGMTTNGLFVTSTIFCFCAMKKYWIALASVGTSGGLITLTMTSCNSTKVTLDPQLASLSLAAKGNGQQGGSPGDNVHLFFTTTEGSYPDGWFFGIDITVFEVFQQLNLAATLGPLVQGTLDIDANYEFASFSTGPSTLSGVTIYLTTIFFDASGTVAQEICPTKFTFP